MGRDEKEMDEKKPLVSAIGIDEQLDLYEDVLIIRKKGLSNSQTPIKELNPRFINSFIIKPAGTLYDGFCEIISGPYKHRIDFKNYGQQGFEEIKERVKK